MRSLSSRSDVVRKVTASAFALAAAVSVAAGAGAFPANATTTTQLPFMCFNTSDTFHQIFGPNSFFLNENQQGLTSFAESSPNAHHVATLPLHTGTAAVSRRD